MLSSRLVPHILFPLVVERLTKKRWDFKYIFNMSVDALNQYLVVIHQKKLDIQVYL